MTCLPLSIHKLNFEYMSRGNSWKTTCVLLQARISLLSIHFEYLNFNQDCSLKNHRNIFIVTNIFNHAKVMLLVID